MRALAARLAPHPAPKEFQPTPFWCWTIGAGLWCGDADKKKALTHLYLVFPTQKEFSSAIKSV